MQRRVDFLIFIKLENTTRVRQGKGVLALFLVQKVSSQTVRGCSAAWAGFGRKGVLTKADHRLDPETKKASPILGPLEKSPFSDAQPH